MRKKVLCILVAMSVMVAYSVPCFAESTDLNKGQSKKVEAVETDYVDYFELVDSLAEELSDNPVAAEHAAAQAHKVSIKGEDAYASNGIGSLSAKALYKILKSNKTRIVKAVKKVSPKAGEKLESKYSTLLNYIEKAKGGVESILTSGLKKIGLSAGTAEAVADAIITVVSLFV